jgi:hypothetical protein
MATAHGKWDIHPDGVSSIINRTADVAKGLESEARSYSHHLQNAATYAGTLTQDGDSGSATGATTGLVALALSQFAEATDKSLNYLADHTGKVLQGTVDATRAYLRGDLDMAANAQTGAVKDPGPPAYSLPKQGSGGK